MKNNYDGWRMGFKVALVAMVAVMLYTFSDHNQVPQDILNLWETEAQQIPWFKPWTKTLEWREPGAHWFVDGQLNASHACLDVHIKNGRGDHRAIVWESELGEQRDGPVRDNVRVRDQDTGPDPGGHAPAVP